MPSFELERLDSLRVDPDCPLRRDHGHHEVGDCMTVLGDGQEETMLCTCGYPLRLGAGKNCGTLLRDVDKGYLNWMLTGGKAELTDQAKEAVRRVLDRRP